MELIFRLLGTQLTIYLGPDEAVETEQPSDRLGTSDHSFGFAPDPVFPELIWDEEE